MRYLCLLFLLLIELFLPSVQANTIDITNTVLTMSCITLVGGDPMGRLTFSKKNIPGSTKPYLSVDFRYVDDWLNVKHIYMEVSKVQFNSEQKAYSFEMGLPQKSQSAALTFGIAGEGIFSLPPKWKTQVARCEITGSW